MRMLLLVLLIVGGLWVFASVSAEAAAERRRVAELGTPSPEFLSHYSAARLVFEDGGTSASAQRLAGEFQRVVQ